MTATEVVRARIDADLKKAASAVLSGMGLSLSDAIRMMLVRVAAEQALPFEARVPNRETTKAIEAVQRGEVERFSSAAALLDDLNNDED